jgi:hypothetical protein
MSTIASAPTVCPRFYSIIHPSDECQNALSVLLIVPVDEVSSWWGVVMPDIYEP